MGRARAGAAAAVAVALAALSGCAVLTQPLTQAERERLAEESRRSLFEGQERIAGPLTLAQATARALKYQADHRLRQMEEAAAAAQLEVARFDLLPRLALNAGYTTRSNEAFGFGFSPNGTVAANPSASVERTRSTASLGLTWNLLDFGVSYFRAKQYSDQRLITEERRRKAVQTLLHDVRVAWWRAEAAERLLPAADRLLADVDRAIEKTRLIEARKLLPPVQTATLRRALLDLSQQIALRRQDLAQSRVELAALVNAPPGEELRVASPETDARAVLDLTADLEKLEGLALAQRPELAEEGYRARITADEARRSLVALLPGISLDFGRNYDSNKFLVNNAWTSAGVNVAANLMKVFSLPAMKRSEEAQRRVDDARRQAMAMAILAQTRLAGVRYQLVADEYLVWVEAARDDDLIVEYIASSERVGIDNELELIRARARAMASQMNRDLSYANLQASVARLYNSVGYDAVPRDDENREVGELARLIDARFTELERASFSQRPAAMLPSVAFGGVSGAPGGAGKLLQEGIARVLDSAKLKTVEVGADIRLDLGVTLGEVQDGRRQASVSLSAVPSSGALALTREFRSVLAEPIDEEQWRVLGEGAAYRLVSELYSARITRPTLRLSERIEDRARQAASGPAAAPVEPEPAGRLELRLVSTLELPAGGAGEPGLR